MGLRGTECRTRHAEDRGTHGRRGDRDRDRALGSSSLWPRAALCNSLPAFTRGNSGGRIRSPNHLVRPVAHDGRRTAPAGTPSRHATYGGPTLGTWDYYRPLPFLPFP
eukprot:1227227-Pyramimonas_sp.AAC.1